MVDAASSGHKISLFFHVCSECIPTGTTFSRKEADYWLETWELHKALLDVVELRRENFPPYSLRLSQNKLPTASYCSISLPLRLVAHRLPHTASSVFTLSYWIQRSILSITLFPQIWKLQNSIFLGRSCQKLCMFYPRRWELAWRFHVPATKLLSALFCPATAAVCLGKTFWDSKLTAWIRLRHTALADLHHRAPTRRQMRARRQYVAQTNAPSKSHRCDVPEVEFKKKTPVLANLGDFCLSGLRRVFAGFCKLQGVLDAS